MKRLLSKAVVAVSLMFAGHAAQASQLDPLTPENSIVLMVDYQPQFVFSVQSMDVSKLISNAEGLSMAAKVFNVPTFYATISANQFGGQFFHQLTDARPDVKPFDRTVINPMEYPPLNDAIAHTGRKKLLVSGLWTDSCVTLPVLSALKEGYEVYVVVDASGDVSKESHEMAVQRMVKAGAIPVTWLAVMLEWQGDWKRHDTAVQVQKIAQTHGGAWGQGIDYFQTMVAPKH
ncbi:isochorismatase family protein [Dyella agri]|uniref:Isochorismatase family protein n=1 Tax=Dyella agri TaxID=1926869 RepID=A0ABW8KKR4_9GAMM